METNIEKIAEMAEDRDDGNWQFRSHLKGYPENIDSLVHHYHQAVADRMDCTSCGACCKRIQPSLDQEDIRQLSESNRTSVDQFTREYLQKDQGDDDGEWWTFRERPCPFLQHNRCSCHPSRPRDCRSFPHLHKPDVVHRLIGVVENYAICPIVFNVYELLKRSLWAYSPHDSATSEEPPAPEIRVRLSDIIEGIDFQGD